MTRRAPRQILGQRGVRAGAACWVATGLYFVVEVAVAAAWPQHYSFNANIISDLGAVSCGEIVEFGGAAVPVCSPWHFAMNAAFIIVGVLTAAGAVLTRCVWPYRRATTVGATFVALAGLGAVLIGLAPIDVNLTVHAAGSLLQVPGAVAPLLLGLAVRRQHPTLAWSSILCGAVGTLAVVLFTTQVSLGLGVGTLERLAIWPLTIWTAAVGTLLFSLIRRDGRSALVE